ncbi:DNA-binding response regulator [Microvirga sp. KLBC 81]|uniref:LuxR C-terminal-related transcriptional regulator n=1 Tax=Microvirga sp. KLBC 81 TaxID=1862707 RepID=UPI000D51B6D3|nr:response regulator transcription factor [Microvirga sp. KLBC 81]PVE23330.1 DNA-binding response regulator [Microvirga sp. KLBC 81]
MDKAGHIALIADDDEYFRLALQTILADQLGFSSIVQAASLDEALEQLSQKPSKSLALFDYSIPGIKSAACLTAVRDCFPNLRLAVLSMSQQKQDILAALNAGVHGYLPKTISPAQLVSALRLIMDGLIYVPPSVASIAPASDGVQMLKAVTEKRLPIENLTPRQREVLELLMQGKSNKEIAKSLSLGEGTVKVHMAALFRAFGARSRAAVAAAGSQLLSG